MALPDDVASSVAVVGDLLYPDNLVSDFLTDYEMGGIALNDASRGINYRPWQCWLQEGTIRIRPVDGAGDGTVVVSGDDITAVSFAFDRNMNPAVAYLQDGLCKLYWYDSTIPGMTTTEFSGATQPRLSHDDKRDGASARSDVIFAYVREGTLYYRQQRDRYTIERSLGVVPSSMSLRNVGMSDRLRLQFVVR
jgi:hypothetical protein